MIKKRLLVLYQYERLSGGYELGYQQYEARGTRHEARERDTQTLQTSDSLSLSRYSLERRAEDLIGTNQRTFLWSPQLLLRLHDK